MIKKDTTFMIGALDCYGVPYTPDNIKLESYIDMVANELRINGLDLEYVNMHSLGFNKTWQLKKILQENYTKEEYYKLNHEYATKVITKSNRFNHPVNPDFLNKYYSNVANPSLKITSCLSESKDPIFIYSCGLMNMDYYLKCPTCDFKQIIPQFLFHLKNNLIKTMQDIEETLNYIKSYNSSVRIYVFGLFPMIEQKIPRYLLQDFYKIYNKFLKDICSKYEKIYYIDVFDNINHVAYKDNHPNYEGQCYMRDQVLNSIYTYQLKK